jgi:hypothetical protein
VSIEAMKQAIEALKGYRLETNEAAIKALRQAIEQAEKQKPVAEDEMKPFDLEAAKRGEPIQCRDGTPAKFIAHVPDAYNGPKVVAMRDKGVIYIWHESGEFVKDEKTDSDLVMAPKKRTVWVSLYETGFDYHFDTEEEANECANAAVHDNRIGKRAYPVEIEE